MPQNFVHLHLHTQYSLLDGLNRIPEVLEKAASFGQPAIAMTDHGNMHGAIQFFEAAKKVGIKPILGCELYVTPGSRFDRTPRSQGGAGTNHLTVLAQNMEGYTNLCRLVSLAFREGFYFKPRVDHELLRQYSDGLIALSGCLASEVGSFSKLEDLAGARTRAEMYATIFPGRYYFEVQPHPIAEQQKLNSFCRDLAVSLGIPLIATTDCHYLDKEDHYAQEVLMCVSTGKLVTDPDRIRHEGVDLHLKTGDEMLQEFSDWKYAQEAIQNSLEIAERCNLDFDFSTYYMPKFEASEESFEAVMTKNARAGLNERLEEIRARRPGWQESDRAPYDERLNEELALITKMGFPGYFLVVADFIVWAKEHGIPVGPGRGSAAGSLVAYALRITELDPIEHKLLFERFLNPERVSLPDIDVDFCIHGRDRVIQYVVEKYGKEKVAQIATFGTLKAKAALKDVGRALGMSFAETDRIAKLVPAPRQGFDYPLKEALKMEPRLKEYAEGEGEELIQLAMKIEGLNRHTSTHAAGVVIGDRPLIDLLPMMVDKDGNDVTQYSMKYVEKVGLVKFDFLGLKTLTVIHSALRLIRDSQGVEVDLATLLLDDAKTYETLCAGNTTGIFQLESSGITDMTIRLRPSVFNDLVAILALYRPGPLDSGMAEHYIERKNAREKVEYLHPLMENILSDTYGIILYQEQIMQLARELAGYSLAEADLLRRAMGKKIPAEMAKQKSRFIEGALERQIDLRVAEEIFSQMETFARYGFNRSHSAAYALISFQTSYLKAHFPVEFMAALMSHEAEDSDKVLKNLNECRASGIEVLPPDVNRSMSGFSVQGTKIRYGLSAVKGIGEKVVNLILSARDSGGDFVDLEDFVERVDQKALNRKVLESLIKCGAFDFCGETRHSLCTKLEEVLRLGQSLQREKNDDQMSLFSGPSAGSAIPRRTPSLPEWPVNRRLAYEREALGFYISGHPLDKHRSLLKRLGAYSSVKAKEAPDKAQVRIGGVVTALRLRNTRKGDRYASFQFEDSFGTVEAIAWPDTYRQVSHLVTCEEPVIASGRLDVSDERRTFIIEKMESLITLRDKSARQGVLVLNDDDPFDEKFEMLVRLFRRYNGECPVKVRLTLDGKKLSVALKDQAQVPVRVSPSEELCDAVEQMFGRPVLMFL